MKKLLQLTTMFALSTMAALAQTSAGASGSGPYAVPAAAAYSILENAAHKIVADNGLATGTVVIYDANTFGLIPSYQTAVKDLQKALTDMCPVNPAGLRPQIALGPVDVGSAASGLAALVTAFTPAYAIQGGALTFDNTALIAAFAEQAGDKVVFPGYLLPAAKGAHNIACGGQNESQSLADLWYAAAAQADSLRQEIANNTGNTQAEKDQKQALQNKLDAYSKVAETYLTIDKGTSLLGKLLVVQSLINLAGDGVKVIDLKLDAVGMESVTRTWLGFKKTSFACNVAAHYTLLQFSVTPSLILLKPVRTDLVNILLKVRNEDTFGSSVSPIGIINGPNAHY